MIKKFACLLLLPNALYAQDQVEVLGLDACIRMALKSNLSVQQRMLDAESARLDLVASRTTFLPRLWSSISANNNWGRSIDPTTNQFTNEQNQSFSLTGGGEIVLFNGLQRFWNMSRARLNAEANNYDLETTRNSTILDVTTLYLDVLLNKELLANARYQLESSQQQLERSTSMVEQGNAPRTELLNMQAQVASNQVDLLRAENALAFSFVRLKQALLIKEDRSIDIESQDLDILEDESFTTLVVEDVYRRALTHQPQVKSADLQVQSSKMAARAAWGDVMPSLSMQFQLRTNYSSANKQRTFEDTTRPVDVVFMGQTVEVLFPDTKVTSATTVPFGTQLDDNLTNFLGLNLSIPIFQRWEVSTRIQKSMIRHKKAELTAQQVRNDLRREVETAYNAFKDAFLLYQAILSKTRAIEESFRSTENGYLLGTVNDTDYQVGHRQLFQVRSELLRAKYTYLFRMKILDFYQGNLSI